MDLGKHKRMLSKRLFTPKRLLRMTTNSVKLVNDNLTLSNKIRSHIKKAKLTLDTFDDHDLCKLEQKEQELVKLNNTESTLLAGSVIAVMGFFSCIIFSSSPGMPLIPLIFGGFFSCIGSTCSKDCMKTKEYIDSEYSRLVRKYRLVGLLE